MLQKNAFCGEKLKTLAKQINSWGQWAWFHPTPTPVDAQWQSKGVGRRRALPACPGPEPEPADRFSRLGTQENTSCRLQAPVRLRPRHPTLTATTADRPAAAQGRACRNGAPARHNETELPVKIKSMSTRKRTELQGYVRACTDLICLIYKIAAGLRTMHVIFQATNHFLFGFDKNQSPETSFALCSVQ